MELQTQRCQFGRENQTHADLVINKPHDSKNDMFQSMTIKYKMSGIIIFNLT